MNKVLTSAVIKIFRPLVRTLLKNGIPYGTCSDLLKWVYVHETMDLEKQSNLKVTNSKIATKTGISRHEVKKILEDSSPEDNVSIEKYNKAAKIISVWLNDIEYSDEFGNPADLQIEGDKSFKNLVRKYCGDLPVKPIIDELVSVGALKVLKNNHVRLLAKSYINPINDEEKFKNLGNCVSDLISTINHNIEKPGVHDFIQLRVSSHDLTDLSKPKFLKISKEKGFTLLNDLDQWLENNTNPKPGEKKYRAGVGVYYFEEPIDE